jgi:hypothetical protein
MGVGNYRYLVTGSGQGQTMDTAQSARTTCDQRDLTFNSHNHSPLFIFAKTGFGRVKKSELPSKL